MADPVAAAPSVLSPLAQSCASLYNGLVDFLNPRKPFESASREVAEIYQKALVRTDISDHLGTLFVETLAAKPALIVELGVRTGESTFVLERAARLLGCKLVSVDIDDCSSVCSWKDWTFVKSDDLTFAQAWPQWSKERQLPAKIDVLFIDTSHMYEHTVAEIKHWFPCVSETGKVIFHDTNQRKIYKRSDGSIGIGWNSRGVIRAVEEHFGTSFDGNHDFVELRNGWIIRHQANCNGFTVLTKTDCKAAK
jgi:cephalosporin hydroxylase